MGIRDYAPLGCYPCQGEDKWVALVIRSDEEWERSCEVIGRRDLKSETKVSHKIWQGTEPRCIGRGNGKLDKA